MARPMTPAEIVAALKKWGVPYKEVPNWQTRNRDQATGLAFGPVHGFMIHHTGSDAPDTNNLALIRDGRSDLPGPLAQFGCDDNGTIWLIGWGRANHAGGGDPVVLNAVIEEKYGDYPPKTTKHQGSAGATDGNDHFYGVETFYSGANPPTKPAYTSLVLLAAAICDHHGWTAKSVIGHKEWSNWKWDPGRVNMRDFRNDVQAALNAQGERDAAYAEALVNARAAKRQLKRARAKLQLALENLNAAIEVGHNLRGMRRRVRQIAMELDNEIEIMNRRY